MIGFGAPHRHFRECDSTNTRARALADAGAPGGLIVTAAAQSAGRGRHGRSWVAPPGKALLYSALLRPLTLANELLPLAVPLAVCEAIERLAPVSCEVKWPNDIWIERRKVAGILVEARADEAGGFAVIGVGINVAVEPDEFPHDVRGLATSVGHGTRVGALRSALDAALGTWIEVSKESVLAEFGRRDALAGEEVEWSSTSEPAESLRGVARGISGRGELRVELRDGGYILLSAGEVHLGRSPRG